MTNRVRAQTGAALEAHGCFGAADNNSSHRTSRPVKRQSSHPRASRSTAGSVQWERQREVAAGPASSRVLARTLQALRCPSPRQTNAVGFAAGSSPWKPSLLVIRLVELLPHHPTDR